MKISNETKVGVLTVVALTLLILGYNFLKGKDILQKQKKVYAVFSETGSLEKSNDVKLKGKSIGKVYDIRFTNDNADSVLVVINLTTSVNIPSTAVASITSPIAGSSYIVVELSKDPTLQSRTGSKYLKDGDTILTTINPGFLGDLNSQVTPTLEKARRGIDSLTAVLASINKFLDPEAKNNIHTIVSSLVRSSASLEQLLNTENGMLAHSLDNMNSVTNNLKRNNDTITDILHNTKVVSSNLADLNLGKVVDSLQSAIDEIKGVVYKVNHNNGSLGLLMNDRSAYDNIQKTIQSLQILIDDIRVHPKRYVNISIFGKKDKGDYLTSPVDSSNKNKK